MDSEAENVFVMLSARQLRSDITIVSRFARENAANRLERAGANRVISPDATNALGTPAALESLEKSFQTHKASA